MQKLTAQEEEVMQVIWKSKGGFVRSFMENLIVPIPYTTVASTVKNLEKKGFVSATKMANSIQYLPIISESAYAKKHLSGFVQDYFENSYKDLVTFFVKDKKLSKHELKEIISLIEQKKK